MKTKTQIKRKAKRMISLLLTAMLIISTMVVGLSVVNAATTERTVYFVKNSNVNTWGSDKIYAYAWKKGTSTRNATWPGQEMTKENFHIAAYGSADIYSCKLDISQYDQIIFNNNNKQTVDLDLTSDVNIFIPTSSIQDNKRKCDSSYYSELDPVATSVSLTPTTQNINAGDSATLTASLTGKNSELGEVKFQLLSNDLVVDEKVSSELSVTFKVNPENTTTYKVMASATNYNSIVSNEATVKVGTSETFYLFYSAIGLNQDSVSDWPENNKIQMNFVNGKYVAQLNLKYQDSGQNQYFAINNSPDKPTSTSQLWKDTSQYSIDSTVRNVSDKAPQENGQIYFFRFAYYQLSSVTIEFDGVNKVAITDGSSTAENVTIKVPTVANATVKVTAGGHEHASGTFDIEVGSSFTVNVTPATGYKVSNISYNNADYNNGEEITAVKDATDITVTVAVDTVNVDFTKLNNATINVSYINDQATSATAKITDDTTLAMQKGTEFTVTVTHIADYELKSIAYGTATSSENPATFTASANGAVTVTVEQTTPVVDTVTVTVPFVVNASVAVEYTNNKGAVTTTTITDTNADIVMKKDTDFTVTLNVNSGYKCDKITMTYASSSKFVNPATFTASTDGTLTITADISQTSTGEATIKFKSARSYMYKVSMSVNGAAATEMTRPDKASTSNDDNFGTSYTGTLTFCWYTQKITVTNGETTTLSFKTSGTKLNAKVSAKLEAGKTYYFAVDDIAPSSNTEVTAVELPSGKTQSDQMKRNYFHSARHLIYNGTAEDSVLGFTNIDNKKHMIGELLNDSNSADALSVMSATAVQKSVASVEEYSDLQNTLLDANMNGKLDVKDATLIQKAVVGLV